MSVLSSRAAKSALLVALPAALLVAPQISSASVVGARTFQSHARALSQKSTTPLILVANEGGSNGGSILEFPESANGNVAPSVAIGVHNGGPIGIAVDSKRFAITDGNTGRDGSLPGAETFALDSNDNSGPLTIIECFPKFASTHGVAFDNAGDLYVGDHSQIEVFKRNANNCAKPISTISEAGGGIAIDTNNVLYVANEAGGTIDLFAPGSITRGAQIGGSSTGLVEPVSVALDAALNVYVLDFETQAVSEFAAGATGNVAPIRVISGSNTGFSNSFAEGLAVSRLSGDIFVANPSSNSILTFAANASGNSSPIQTIAGGATHLDVPLNIALEE